jgi:hypothetical protein
MGGRGRGSGAAAGGGVDAVRRCKVLSKVLGIWPLAGCKPKLPGPKFYSLSARRSQIAGGRGLPPSPPLARAAWAWAS